MNQPDKNSLVNSYLQKNVAKGLLRLYAFVIPFEFVSFLLGYAMWMILHGIFMGILRLAPIWKPAQYVMMKMMGVPQSDINYKPMQFHWWHLLFFGLQIGISVALIGFGIYFLFQVGFKQQNLIYLIFIKK